jgi:hypothetical protein
MALRAVAVVVVDVEHRDAIEPAVAQCLRRQRRVVQEAVATEEVGAGMVAGWAAQREGRRHGARSHCTCGEHRTVGPAARGDPGAGGQRRARIERVQAQARREVVGLHVGPEAAHRPHRRQGIELGIRRVQRHPVGPGAREEVEVARRVHSPQQRLEGGILARMHVEGRELRPDAAAPQFGQHMVKPLRHFVAIHKPAAEHLVAAGVAGVLGVVDDQHGSLGVGQACDFARRGQPPVERITNCDRLPSRCWPLPRPGPTKSPSPKSIAPIGRRWFC